MMIKKYKQDNALKCTICKKEFFVNDFDEDTLEEIVDYCCLLRMKQEINLLYKAKKMYNEYPQSKVKMVPQNSIMNELKPSNEEIELWTSGDKSLKDFLLSSSFDLQKRLVCLKELVKEDIAPVICPDCNSGIIIFKEERLRDYEPKFT